MDYVPFFPPGEWRQGTATGPRRQSGPLCLARLTLPAVSVVLPFRDAESTIREAVDSILEQTLSPPTHLARKLVAERLTGLGYAIGVDWLPVG